MPVAPVTDEDAAPGWVTDLLGPGAAFVAVMSGGISRDTVLLEVPPAGARVVARRSDHDGWSPRRWRALRRAEQR